jgi:hypothetical protein
MYIPSCCLSNFITCIFNAYMPSRYPLRASEDPPPSRELEELVQYCESENLYLLVGCDSNAHHTAWGSTNCNGRGEALIVSRLLESGDS